MTEHQRAAPMTTVSLSLTVQYPFHLIAGIRQGEDTRHQIALEQQGLPAQAADQPGCRGMDLGADFPAETVVDMADEVAGHI